jgi:hypothetical protein
MTKEKPSNRQVSQKCHCFCEKKSLLDFFEIDSQSQFRHIDSEENQ